MRLLQFGVQAAPPIKDTGNDLVAFLGRSVRTIQIKTGSNRISKDRRLPKHYDILAFVHLHTHSGVVALDASRVFVVPRSAVGTRRSVSALAPYELHHDNVERSMNLLACLFSANGP
jgi:hypothetical protein